MVQSKLTMTVVMTRTIRNAMNALMTSWYRLPNVVAPAVMRRTSQEMESLVKLGWSVRLHCSQDFQNTYKATMKLKMMYWYRYFFHISAPDRRFDETMEMRHLTIWFLFCCSRVKLYVCSPHPACTCIRMAKVCGTRKICLTVSWRLVQVGGAS